MKNFNNFINEQFEPIQPNEKGKLSIELDNTEYSDEWKLTLTLENASTLIENQQQISSACGEAAWNSIEPIAVDELRKATTLEDSEKIYDKLYDVFDKYEIYINTGNIEEHISENMEQQEFAVGDIITVDFYGDQVTAKISKIVTKNSYLIQIEQNSQFLPKEHQIKGEQIINMISSNEKPGSTNGWNDPLKQYPSNDFAINGAGTPGVPAPGTPIK